MIDNEVETSVLQYLQNKLEDENVCALDEGKEYAGNFKSKFDQSLHSE